MSLDRLKKVVKRIPGVQLSHLQIQRLVNIYSQSSSQSSPGAWLYTPNVLSWIYEPTLKHQLPPLYRFFATYCALQNRLWKPRRIIGGEFVLKCIIRLTKFIGLKDYAQLNLGPHTVFLNLQDPRMLVVHNELVKDKANIEIVKSFIAEGDTFVDVGANHGSFSIIATKLVGQSGLVVAIEPQPRLAYLLEKSLAASAKCKYQLHSIACGDRNGQADFYVPIETSGFAGLFPAFSATSTHRQISVPLKRFDDAIDWQHFPGQIFLKLDVEGSELVFLRGASAMLRARKPRIMLEINPSSMKASGSTGEAIVYYLQELGYEYFVEVQFPTERRSLHELDTTRKRNVIVI